MNKYVGSISGHHCTPSTKYVAMRHKEASSTLSSRNVSADSSTITLNLLPMPMIKGRGLGDFLKKVTKSVESLTKYMLFEF